MIPNFSLTHPLGRIGRQPIALAAATLLLIVAGIASIALWRSYNGISPETDRAVAARQLQVRTAQASAQLVEKTKGLEQTEQESIDQLQQLQDQLQTVRRQLAAQQADNKHLSDQISSLNETVDGLRQSFASAQPSEASPAPASRHHRIHAVRIHPKRPKSPG